MGYLVKLGGFIAIVVVTLGIMSGTGYKLGWWDLGTAFKMLEWTIYGAGASAVLGLIGLIFTKQKGLPAATFATGAVIGLFVVMQVLTAGKVPAIHDISTDTENPPQFVKIVALRGEKSNSLDYTGKSAPVARGSSEMKSNRELQEGYYTDIKPLDLSIGTGPCHTQAAATARGQGWEMINVDAEALIIEATDTTFWFGFKDDVVIRISGDTMICRVDMRSVSRVGKSDVGINADRIMAYMAALKEAAH